MPRLLTQAQYARKTKYSRARITQLVKQGVIILRKGKVDPAQADAAIEANIDRSRQLKAEAKIKSSQTPQLNFTGNGFNTELKNGNGSGQFNTDPQSQLPSLTEVRRDHELKKLEKTEIEIKVKRGQLVPKDEATKMIIALGSAVKLALMNLPRRLASVLVPITDEKEMEVVLRSEIKDAIRVLERSHHAKSKHPRSKNPKGSLGNHLASA